jgi:hypothetical protein
MQRLVTTDDHSGTEIMDGIESSQASVSISRNGKGLVWPGLNLTDETWEGLTKLIRDYLPNVEPITSETREEDSQADKRYLTAPKGSERTAEPSEPAIPGKLHAAGANQLGRELVTSSRVPSPRSAPTGELTGKDYSRAVRAWWYGLSDESIKALGLKVPNRTVNFGKMPQAVYDAYESAH